MNYVDILKECLQNPFSIENYRKFIVNFLKGTQLREITRLRSAEIFAEYNFYVEGFALVANYVDPKGKRVGIFAVKLKSGRDIEKARNKQRNFVARLIADNNLDAALAAFYLNEETKWRLSFVRLDYEFVKGKIKQNLTPAKRYSYLVGKDEPCHTAQESLLPVFEAEDFRPTIDSIEQAFSVEKVTKQFFEKYKEKYLQLAEYLESTPCFVEEAQTRGFTTEQFAKKLMGQIVFMYFLQKKGWLGVKAVKQKITEREYKDLYFHNARTRQFTPQLYTPNDDGTYKLNPSALASLSDEDEMYIAMEIKGEAWGTGPRTFMRDLFNFAMKKKANFFDDYLEPLFYEGMNRQRDADNYYPRLHCRIPFLNGGLFEELGHYDWRNNAFHIPNEMFSNAHLKSDPREADGILDIFDRYNFTMNEDEPLEKEVAVDPEMLGKIFENLLDVTDRKSKGAFYTPREIVHYMCQESLVNYLMNTVGTPYDDTKDFVLYGDIMKDEDCSREGTYGVLPEMLMSDSIYQNLQAIDNALADVRIADPAVGSGAFPMGMLSEIVKLREIITEYMARDLCLRPEYRGSKNQSALKIAIRKLHNVQRNPYKLKKETMRNSIYAVDIEPSAVDIAKLRLWLSLVVEQEIDPSDPENDSPLTLPNLDCNVMCGNSLIDEFEGIDLGFDSFFFGDNGQGAIWSGGIDEDLERLFAAQKEYFYADNHDKKKKYADLIADIRARLLDHAFTSADAEKRARFDRANAEASTPFFLWKLNFAKVFKEKGGFDIVIGNPPYISTKGSDEQQKVLLKQVFGFADDFYYHFIVKGLDLLKSHGCIAMITPDTYFTTLTKQDLRKKLLGNKLKVIVHLGHDIFDSAMVSTAICVDEKSKAEETDRVTVIDVKGLKSISAAPAYSIDQSIYRHSINQAIFVPNAANLIINEKFSNVHSELISRYWGHISTSKGIGKNSDSLSTIRERLCVGDTTLLGLLTEGGVGLQTANNGKFVGVRKGTKEAQRIALTRIEKLVEFNQRTKNAYTMPEDEFEVRRLFDALKEKYGRDIFGQGYLYRIVDDSEMADLQNITDAEREKGIGGSRTFVPYDKGDKDGNRWYLETPYVIDWSKENVTFLRQNSGKKGEGMPVVRNPQFYFKEGFCYSDIKTFYLRCRLKGVSIHDVKSMSFFPLDERTPAYYLISIINSKLIASIVYNFLNNTPSFQINDCRMLPIIIPTNDQLSAVKMLFDKAVEIKRRQFAGEITIKEAEKELIPIQEEVDLFVYDLYGFSPEEIALVENTVK